MAGSQIDSADLLRADVEVQLVCISWFHQWEAVCSLSQAVSAGVFVWIEIG